MLSEQTSSSAGSICLPFLCHPLPLLSDQTARETQQFFLKVMQRRHSFIRSSVNGMPSGTAVQKRSGNTDRSDGIQPVSIPGDCHLEVDPLRFLRICVIGDLAYPFTDALSV